MLSESGAFVQTFIGPCLQLQEKVRIALRADTSTYIKVEDEKENGRAQPAFSCPRQPVVPLWNNASSPLPVELSWSCHFISTSSHRLKRGRERERELVRQKIEIVVGRGNRVDIFVRHFPGTVSWIYDVTSPKLPLSLTHCSCSLQLHSKVNRCPALTLYFHNGRLLWYIRRFCYTCTFFSLFLHFSMFVVAISCSCSCTLMLISPTPTPFASPS